MDPRNGEVLALGSYPSFDANLFAKPIDQETYERLNSEESGAPLFNRATTAAYPTGSTFKPVTAFAALADKIITPSTPLNDPGRVPLRRARVQERARRRVRLARAPARAHGLLGRLLLPARRAAQRARAGAAGVGAQARLRAPRPGSTCRASSAASCPTAEWRDDGFREYERCRKKAKLAYQSQAALFACGGIDRGWSGGDNVNLSVGQGDLQATPLQLATAYAAIANGGKVVTPHLGQQVEELNGSQLEQIRKPAKRRLKLERGALDAVRTGLLGAATGEGGTSTDVMKGFPYPVYGKTGTAERGIDADQSWYACFVDDPVKPIVVVTTVEKGGFGAETAAPAARLILSKWFGVSDHEFRVGSSATR